MTNPLQPHKPLWKRLLTWLASIIVIAALLFCVAYVLLWGGFDFGKENLSFTKTCGDYRLNFYLTEKGNGRIEYAHKSGKVYGQYPMTPQTEPDPIWDADCKGVRLGTGESVKRLEVSK